MAETSIYTPSCCLRGLQGSSGPNSEKVGVGEFPDSPRVRTPHSHCRGPWFNPWSGNRDPASCILRSKKPPPAPKKKTKEKKGGYEGSEKLGCAPSVARQAATSEQRAASPQSPPGPPSPRRRSREAQWCPLCAAGGMQGPLGA